MCFLTSATGGAACCMLSLHPGVCKQMIRVHTGVRGILVRVGFLFDDIIVDDVTLMFLFTELGWAHCLSCKKVEGCWEEANVDSHVKE